MNPIVDTEFFLIAKSCWVVATINPPPSPTNASNILPAYTPPIAIFVSVTCNSDYRKHVWGTVC